MHAFLDVKIMPASVPMCGSTLRGWRRDLGKWPLGRNGFYLGGAAADSCNGPQLPPSLPLVDGDSSPYTLVNLKEAQRLGVSHSQLTFPRRWVSLYPNCVILHECPVWRENHPKSVGSSLHLVSWDNRHRRRREGRTAIWLPTNPSATLYPGNGAFPPW